MTEIAALLHRLRTVHRMTQMDIERATGIPQPRLSRWQSGSSTVASDALRLKALLDMKDAEASFRGEG
jgi:transcriptional regulator with XRE-family HTH domain